ncbi:hypothetical protein ACFOZ5_09375 [Marinobacter lacisalsi]|uniref:Uncharacterized protein n=1 Tax=Marinobacter lacisalsi TaxID=475979 RepID=A0ABV8QHL1_9GAMM
MRRSIRSSLFLLVAPFALTFTLLAWVVSSKIGPWLAQPLVANCADKGYSEWFCNLQAGLMPWLLLGAGILILLSVTATLSLGLFRAHLNELQKDVLDFQKGHRNTLDSEAPTEISPLVQLLNRILQAGGEHRPERPSAWSLGTQEPLSSSGNRPVTPPTRTGPYGPACIAARGTATAPCPRAPGARPPGAACARSRTGPSARTQKEAGSTPRARTSASADTSARSGRHGGPGSVVGRTGRRSRQGPEGGTPSATATSGCPVQT